MKIKVTSFTHFELDLRTQINYQNQTDQPTNSRPNSNNWNSTENQCNINKSIDRREFRGRGDRESNG
jgi:hypothetical protein